MTNSVREDSVFMTAVVEVGKYLTIASLCHFKSKFYNNWANPRVLIGRADYG